MKHSFCIRRTVLCLALLGSMGALGVQLQGQTVQSCMAVRVIVGREWQNKANPYDANADGAVDEADNTFIETAFRKVGKDFTLPGIPVGNYFYDVDGNGMLSMTDSDLVRRYRTCVAQNAGAGSSSAASVRGTRPCDDGIDNDLDGTVDGLDKACVVREFGDLNAPEDGPISLTITVRTEKDPRSEDILLTADMKNYGPDAATKSYTLSLSAPANHNGGGSIRPLTFVADPANPACVASDDGSVQCTFADILPTFGSRTVTLRYRPAPASCSNALPGTFTMTAFMRAKLPQRNTTVTGAADYAIVRGTFPCITSSSSSTSSTAPSSTASSRSSAAPSSVPPSSSSSSRSSAQQSSAVIVLKPICVPKKTFKDTVNEVVAGRATNIIDDSDALSFFPGAFTRKGPGGNGGAHAFIEHDPFTNPAPEPARWELGSFPPGEYAFTAFWPTGGSVGGRAIYHLTAWNGETVVADNPMALVISDVAANLATTSLQCDNAAALVGLSGARYVLPNGATRVSVSLRPDYTRVCTTSSCPTSEEQWLAIRGKTLPADSVHFQRQLTAQDMETYYDLLGRKCGNGTVEAGEACDDGNTVDNDYCTNACNNNGHCADGIVQAGKEECDDGNSDDMDACTKTCAFTECHDGKDNDGDSIVDKYDPGCRPDFNIFLPASYQAYNVREQDNAGKGECYDGKDNDGDGLIDSQEAECRIHGLFTDHRLKNANLVKEVPPGTPNAVCVPARSPSPGLISECNDGYDNDCDGLTDAREPVCHADLNMFNEASFMRYTTALEMQRPTYGTTCINNHCTPAPAGTCADGKDNDGDGLIDAQSRSCHTDGNAANTATFDPLRMEKVQVTASSASSVGQSSSMNGFDCDDGKDSDGDGLIDAADPGCHYDMNARNAKSYSTTLVENNRMPVFECGDGKDNDGDGLTDAQEPICHGDKDVHNTQSFVGVYLSNYDYLQGIRENSPVMLATQCAWLPCPGVLAGTCADGKDNDGNSLIDSQEPACHSDGQASNASSFTPRSNEPEPPQPEQPARPSCEDGKDDDGDGLIDADDPGCHYDANRFNAASYEPLKSRETDFASDIDQCSDGKENDGDGLIDAQDPGCHSDGNVFHLDSFTGYGGDAGPQYEMRRPISNVHCTANGCTWDEPGTCADGKDNDGDGLIDAQEAACHTDGNATNRASFAAARNESGTTHSSSSAHSTSSVRSASSAAPGGVLSIITDDQSDAFSVQQQSQWGVWDDGNPQGGSYLWGGKTDAAEWVMGTFAAGTYTLDATWYGYPTASKNATYTVMVNGAQAAQFSGNHTAPSSSSFAWRPLGSFRMNITGNVVIRLTSGDGKQMFADAVRMVKTAQ